MKIVLDTRLSVEQNAAKYFEKAKKARKKLDGTRKAIATATEKLKEEPVKKSVQQKKKPLRKEAWYEKFRWFISSEGFLCVGGKDATTNEIVVKKHAEKNDLAFHTDMAGSPFVIVKAEGKEVGQATKDEAAQFCLIHSRAWKKGIFQMEVFYVKPEQLSKTPNPGEFLPKGAFMVRGTVNYLKSELETCTGQLSDGRVMVASRSAVEANCPYGWLIHPGSDKISDVAKKLAKQMDVHPDEIIPKLPAGGVKLGVKILGTKK